jgi:phage major head subunit gpT-like protein
VRGRCNVGFGLWQLAYASKADLTPDNFETARAAMAKLRGDNGKLLGIKATHLLVPVELEGDGRRLLKNQNDAAGASNPWIDSAELIVSPWLA